MKKSILGKKFKRRGNTNTSELQPNANTGKVDYKALTDKLKKDANEVDEKTNKDDEI